MGCYSLGAQNLEKWTVARSSHFEIYVQAGDKTAQQALTWFEQLRGFFKQNGLWIAGFSDQGRPALRVVAFRSEQEYAEYRLRPFADAYYASDGNSDYILLGMLRFDVAAHEYAHYVVHLGGVHLPACFREGLSEFFSTLRINENSYEVGGDLPARTQTLERNKAKWLPLADLLTVAEASTVARVKRDTDVFYSESWALLDMLITSPQYAARFGELVALFNGGANGARAFREVYGKSLDEVFKDLEHWVGRTLSPKLILSRPSDFDTVQIAELSAVQVRALDAWLSMVSGQLEQARTRYADLLREQPDNPDFAAGLGKLAERQGKREEALRWWQQAVRNRVTDAQLCYRYALLAEEMQMNIEDVKAGLKRALLLAPGFDDARYKLALTYYQAGEYKSAVEQLRAMAIPGETRRYAYWIALSSALLEMQENEQARAAAAEAAKEAKSEAEKATARNIAYMAETDMTVQFSTDSEGHSQMITTRIAHGKTDWNPFIEPADRIEHAKGTLKEVLCSKGKLTGFLVGTPEGAVTLEVADPLHVLMRNSPNEFYCGPAKMNAVEADYAVVQAAGKTKNVLRGMTFE